MNFQWEPIQTTPDVLRQRLKKWTSFNYLTLGPLLPLMGYIAIDILPTLHKHGSLATFFQQVESCMFMCLAECQLIFFINLIVWRISKPEDTKKAGIFCFYFNIFMVLFTVALGLAVTGYFENSALLASAFFSSIVILLHITTVNRLIRYIYISPNTKEAKEQASPCPNLFHSLNMTKTLFWAPFLFPVLGLLVGGIFSWATDTPITQKGILICLCISSVIAIPTILLFWPISIAAFLVKQTEHPSSFQRLVRYLAFFYCKADISGEEITAFQWWLSHPNQEWPPDAHDIFKKINTSHFDWQDINKWSI